jgi:uncharacterized repeat protein (TIGR01451 family)
MKKIILFLLFILAAKCVGQSTQYPLAKIIGLPLLDPYDVAVDAAGNLYITDGASVIKASAYGQHQMQFSTAIEGPYGAFGDALSIALDGDNNIFIANYHCACVQKYTPAGQLLAQYGPKGATQDFFATAVAVAVDASGNIYVVDKVGNQVVKLSNNGELLQRIGSPGAAAGQFNNPSDVTVDGAGNVYVADTDNHRIQKFSATGQFLMKLGREEGPASDFLSPQKVAVDEDGNLLVADNGHYQVRKFNKAGQFLVTIGEWNSLGRIRDMGFGVAVDPWGQVYVPEKSHQSGHSRIQKFSEKGQLLTHFGSSGRQDGKFNYPGGVALDAAGNTYVADTGNNRVQKFSPAGQLLLIFGSRGTGDGQFSAVTDIAVDGSGNIYTLESNDYVSRIQKFNAAGRFIREYDTYSTAPGRSAALSGIAVDEIGNIYFSDLYGDCIVKLDPEGQQVLRFGNQGTAAGEINTPVDLTLDDAGNIFVVDFSNDRIQKFSPTGQFLHQFPYTTLAYYFPATSIAVDAAGNIFLGEVNYIYKFSPAGEFLFKWIAPNSAFDASKDGTKIVAVYNNYHAAYIYSSTPLPVPEENFVRGQVYEDKNRNCLKDSGEPGIPNVVVATDPGPFYGITDRNGNYTFAVDTGTYTVRQILPDDQGRLITQTCPAAGATHTVTLTSYNNNVAGKDFGNQVTQRPYLTASVASTRRRRCFPANTTLSYCNAGSLPVANAKVHLELPPHVVLVSAGAPYTIAPDKHLVFNVGALAPNQCGTIQITDSVVCNNPDIRGLTQCTKVWITPANGTTPAAGWDGSDVTLKAKCISNGRVRLGLYNTGSGAMTDSSAYRLYLDARLALTRRFKLAAGDSLVLQVPANGQTVRLEADQRPGHSTKQSTTVSLEGCGTNAGGKISLGFVAQLPQDDAEPEVDTECLPITDSFDPNDKLVLPAGVTAEHYSAFGQELEYTVRFQNTGNDYAYRVVVVDTLSDKLDLSSLRIVGGSHTYGFTVSGKGRPVLTFTFDNINLPDSSRDQAGSNGFVKFTIKPLKDLPEGTRIENFADIFFDYNLPVRTNTVLNTLREAPVEIASGDALPVTVCTPNQPVSAGDNQAFCGNQTTVLQAQNPVHGQGRWKRISGAGRIEQPHNPRTALSGLGTGDNVFEWSIANGSCATDSLRSRVTVTRYPSPEKPVIASVGVNGLQSSVAGDAYQWYCDNRSLPGTGRRIEADRAGTYTVQVKSGSCSSELSDPVDFKLTSPVLKVLSRIYPNPAGRKFTVALPAGAARVQISIVDAQGKKVAESTAYNPGRESLLREFNLVACRAGVYLVKIQTQEALVVKRVVLW